MPQPPKGKVASDVIDLNDEDVLTQTVDIRIRLVGAVLVQVLRQEDHVLRHTRQEDAGATRNEQGAKSSCQTLLLRTKPDDGCVHTRAVFPCTFVTACCACVTGARE